MDFCVCSALGKAGKKKPEQNAHAYAPHTRTISRGVTHMRCHGGCNRERSVYLVPCQVFMGFCWVDRAKGLTLVCGCVDLLFHVPFINATQVPLTTRTRITYWKRKIGVLFEYIRGRQFIGSRWGVNELTGVRGSDAGTISAGGYTKGCKILPANASWR